MQQSLAVGSQARILVATDLSEPADEAVRQAHAWARAEDAELWVYHVTPRLLGSHMLFPRLVEESALDQPPLQSQVVEVLRERTERLTGRTPDQYRLVVDAGTPYVEIVRQGERLGASLVVVGSHGRSGLAHVFLGDVAERVVRYAHSPVLVARARARPLEHRREILVATDFSSSAVAAITAAAEQARRRGAHLTALRSIERRVETLTWIATFGGTGYQFVRDEYQAERAQAEKRLAALLRRVGAPGDVRVTDGEPASAIVHAAGELDAELVVIGATGLSGLRRMVVGSVAEKVSRAAPCSVLVVRPLPSQAR